MDYSRLLTFKELLAKYKWLKPGTLRMYTFHHDLYDFTRVIYQERKGGKILYFDDEFIDRLKRRNIMAPVKS